MLILLFLFLLSIAIGELFGWISPLYHFFAAAVIFVFVFYLYRRVGQFSRGELRVREELEKTNEVIRALLTTTNLNKLLSLIMDNLIKNKNFDSAFIYLIRENNTLACIATKGAVALNGIKRFTFTLQDYDRIIGRAIKSRLPRMILDVEKEPLSDREIKEKLQLKQFILLPLVVQDKVIGLIIIGNSGEMVEFTQRDLTISKMISNQAAIALQNAQTNTRIQELSIIDELTQVYNRRFFQNRIRDEIELAKRYKSILALAIIDIDYFKNYNDKNGHLAGDVCLKQVTNMISRSLRKTDIVARYGGEEFALILPATDRYGATRILEKIRYDIERYPFEFKHKQPGGNLTISAGIATFPKDAGDFRELISLADQSLYKAKELGRNRVVLYEPPEGEVDKKHSPFKNSSGNSGVH
ncbi:MAG: sensor domain-containing diguanylate cyclase [Elusimicrobia bacterium]|nr:sensor domain-containing diguanylate cyclase [Elusimicrobiota bacterium]